MFPNLMRLIDDRTHVLSAHTVPTTTSMTTTTTTTDSTTASSGSLQLRTTTATTSNSNITTASWAPGFVPPPLTPGLCDYDCIGDGANMTRIGRGRTCRDVAMEMRRMGEELLALDQEDLGASVDGDSDSSESEDEMKGLEECWLQMYRVQRLGGIKVEVGKRKIKMREILGRSCGCYDIGTKNFRLLIREVDLSLRKSDHRIHV